MAPQFREAEAIAQEYKKALHGRMKIYYVIPDYYEDRPKACMNGWGTTFLTIAPDGMALPCHAGRELPGLNCPNIKDASISAIWLHSEAFNKFRGDEWMREPCRSCPEKVKDFGGCRCQAYLLTGDMNKADPVCGLSPDRPIIDRIIGEASAIAELPLTFRNARNSKRLQIH